MTDFGWTIYTAPADHLDAELLRTFLSQQRRDRLFMESTTLELKRERTPSNVVNAIAAMANTDGGIVLLGVDETNPDFDESPGVAANELTAVLAQCQSGLNPAVTPEVTPVAIPGKDRVILVIRIAAEPSLWPVVKNGQVFLRNPGQTIPATHEQILDLVRRRDRPSVSSSMLHVRSIYTPAYREPTEQSRAGDLVLRFASAVYGRTGLPRAIVLGTEARAAITAAVEASALAKLIRSTVPGRTPQAQDALRLDEDQRRSSLFEAHVDVSDGNVEHRLAVRVQVNGQQLSFAVDLHARLGPGLGVDPRPPHFDRGELALGLVCGLETASLSLIPVLAALVGGAPARVDDVDVWIESPRGEGLGEAIGKADATGPMAGRQQMWQLTAPHANGPDEAASFLRHPLEALYVELGFDNERQVVDTDLSWALQRHPVQ